MGVDTADGSFGDHLAQALKNRFVGRDEPMKRLEALLQRAATVPRVASIVATAGMGKTTLATIFRLRAEKLQRKVVWIWCEHALNAAALRDALGPIEALGRDTPTVIVLDGFERLGGLGEHFFRELMPTAGPRTLVVVTSREPLPASVRATLGDMHEEIPLTLFDAEESRQVLERAGVPPEEYERILEIASGLPLALVLACEHHFDGSQRLSRTNPIAALVEELIRDAPDQAHQQALYAASVAPMDAALLRRMLQVRDPSDIYAWLRSRPFVRESAEGLILHEWVGRALFDDLVRRRPSLLRSLSESAVHELLSRMGKFGANRQRELYIQALRTRRDLPLIRETMALDDVQRTFLRHATHDDLETIAGALESHEGPIGLASFRHQFESNPEQFYVTCDETESIIGVLGTLSLTDDVSAPTDPLLERAIALSRTWLSDGLFVFRWMFAIDGYQTFNSALASIMLSGPIVNSSDRRGIFIVENPEAWEPLAPMMLIRRIDTPDITLHSRQFGFFVVDLADHTEDWSDPAHNRYVALKGIIEHSLGMRPPRPRLDREVFDAAVRDAFGSLHNIDQLERNALVDSLLVGETDRGEELRALLHDSVANLAATPRHEDLAATLEHTYLRPAAKQRAAAAELGIPFGTYRYRLRKALEWVSAKLWRQERRRRE